MAIPLEVHDVAVTPQCGSIRGAPWLDRTGVRTDLWPRDGPAARARSVGVSHLFVRGFLLRFFGRWLARCARFVAVEPGDVDG